METSFGEYLRQQRENRELSLEEISQKTKIQKKFLSALENDQYEQLPGLIFVRGFIRAYAEQIGLNPEQTLAQFEEFLKQTKPALSGPKTGPHPKKPRIMLWVLLLVFIGSLIGLALSMVWSVRQPASFKVSPPLKISEPLGETTSAPQPKSAPLMMPVSPPYKLNFKATELCWLLSTIDGKTSKEVMLYPGDSYQLEAQERVSVLIGNAGGVELSVNLIKLKPLGAHWKPSRLLIPEDLPKYLPEKLENVPQEEEKSR